VSRGALTLRFCLLLLVSAFAAPRPAFSQPDKGQNPSCRIQIVGFSGGVALPRFMTVSSFEGIARSVRELRQPDVCIRSFPVLLSGKAHKWVRQNFTRRKRERLDRDEAARGSFSMATVLERSPPWR